MRVCGSLVGDNMDDMLKDRIDKLQKCLENVQSEFNNENYYNLLGALDRLRDCTESAIYLLLTDEEKIDRNKIL
jgi:hypothetical protein